MLGLLHIIYSTHMWTEERENGWLSIINNYKKTFKNVSFCYRFSGDSEDADTALFQPADRSPGNAAAADRIRFETQYSAPPVKVSNSLG